MAHIIKHKKSDGAGIVPHPLELQPGELAINSTDRKLFTVDTLQNKTVRLDRGGTQWDGKDNYYVGDIVTYDDLVYKCIQDASIIPSSTILPTDTNYWQLVVPATANIAFDPLLDYNEGDIVSVDGDLYIAPAPIPAYGPIPTPLNPGLWIDATPDEVGGIVWNNTTTYKTGDIVSYYNGVNLDSNLYIALKDNQGSNPTTLTDWYEFNTPRHNAGTFTPDASKEYPDTSTETSGAVWYINGLPPWTAPPPAPQGGYDMTTGAFTGIHVSNNDRFVWYGLGTDGIDIWLFEQTPDNIVEERGGTAFNSAVFYQTGDIVTQGGIQYQATGPISSGPWDAAEWDPIYSEKGGIAWDPIIQYESGDIISHLGGIYVTPNPAPAPGTSPGMPGWPLISLERGGIMWTLGQSYQIGDSVWDNASGPAALYACTIAHTATTGNGANGSPQQIAATNWTPDVTEDPGAF